MFNCRHGIQEKVDIIKIEMLFGEYYVGGWGGVTKMTNHGTFALLGRK